MLSCLLLSAVSLALGQPAPSGEEAAPAAPAPVTLTVPVPPPEEKKAAEPAKSTPSPPERWALMKALQGTWPGWLLDGNRMRITGWTEGSFTGSSAAHVNLPMGFNWQANEVTVQQNWL